MSKAAITQLSDILQPRAQQQRNTVAVGSKTYAEDHGEE